MGMLDKIHDNTDKFKEQGDSVVDIGNQKIEEANEMRSARDGLEAPDETTQEIIDNLTAGLQEVASEIAEEQIAAPMESVNEGLDEVKNEADESAGIESGNAERISDAVGDYDAVASEAESNFEQYANDLTLAGENAEAINNEFREQKEEFKNGLESAF